LLPINAPPFLLSTHDLTPGGGAERAHDLPGNSELLIALACVTLGRE
jgi:hypothetical protein